MPIQMWELEDFLDFMQVREDDRLKPIPDYFWKTYFSQSVPTGGKKINFAELPVPHRKLAPFVMPTSQGKPVFERRSGKIESFEPGYIKIKDAVRIAEANNVQLGDLINGTLGDPVARYDRAIVEVADFHLRSIDMTRCMMAAEAFINGRVTVRYSADQGTDYPEVVIDYGRNSSLNETLTGTFWDDPDYDIIGMLTDMSNTMYNTAFGGRPVQLLVGSQVAPFIGKNKGILELLDKNMRGSEDTNFTRGMAAVDRPMQYLGRIGGVGPLEIWTYKDVVEAPDGTMVDLFNPKDALLIAPGAGGVMAYGGIWDIDAFEGGRFSAEVFPKMFKANDPGEMFVMHQSAPLPVNVYPNRVSKMRVLG